MTELRPVLSDRSVDLGELSGRPIQPVQISHILVLAIPSGECVAELDLRQNSTNVDVIQADGDTKTADIKAAITDLDESKDPPSEVERDTVEQKRQAGAGGTGESPGGQNEKLGSQIGAPESHKKSHGQTNKPFVDAKKPSANSDGSEPGSLPLEYTKILGGFVTSIALCLQAPDGKRSIQNSKDVTTIWIETEGVNADFAGSSGGGGGGAENGESEIGEPSSTPDIAKRPQRICAILTGDRDYILAGLCTSDFKDTCTGVTTWPYLVEIMLLNMPLLTRLLAHQLRDARERSADQLANYTVHTMTDTGAGKNGTQNAPERKTDGKGNPSLGHSLAPATLGGTGKLSKEESEEKKKRICEKLKNLFWNDIWSKLSFFQRTQLHELARNVPFAFAKEQQGVLEEGRPDLMIPRSNLFEAILQFLVYETGYLEDRIRHMAVHPASRLKTRFTVWRFGQDVVFVASKAYFFLIVDLCSHEVIQLSHWNKLCTWLEGAECAQWNFERARHPRIFQVFDIWDELITEAKLSLSGDHSPTAATSEDVTRLVGSGDVNTSNEVNTAPPGPINTSMQTPLRPANPNPPTPPTIPLYTKTDISRSAPLQEVPGSVPPESVTPLSPTTPEGPDLPATPKQAEKKKDSEAIFDTGDEKAKTQSDFTKIDAPGAPPSSLKPTELPAAVSPSAVSPPVQPTALPSLANVEKPKSTEQPEHVRKYDEIWRILFPLLVPYLRWADIGALRCTCRFLGNMDATPIQEFIRARSVSKERRQKSVQKAMMWKNRQIMLSNSPRDRSDGAGFSPNVGATRPGASGSPNVVGGVRASPNLPNSRNGPATTNYSAVTATTNSAVNAAITSDLLKTTAAPVPNNQTWHSTNSATYKEATHKSAIPRDIKVPQHAHDREGTHAEAAAMERSMHARDLTQMLASDALFGRGLETKKDRSSSLTNARRINHHADNDEVSMPRSNALGNMAIPAVMCHNGQPTAGMGGNFRVPQVGAPNFNQLTRRFPVGVVCPVGGSANVYPATGHIPTKESQPSPLPVPPGITSCNRGAPGGSPGPTGSSNRPSGSSTGPIVPLLPPPNPNSRVPSRSSSVGALGRYQRPGRNYVAGQNQRTVLKPVQTPANEQRRGRTMNN